MNPDYQFIIPEIRRTSEVQFHHDVAPGLRFLAIDHTLFKESPVYIAIRRVENVSFDQPEYIDWHTHDVDSLFLFLGDGEGLRGLHGLVRLGSNEKEIESPMTVFIPNGVSHSYKLTKGRGTFISILLDGNYNASTFKAKLSNNSNQD